MEGVNGVDGGGGCSCGFDHGAGASARNGNGSGVAVAPAVASRVEFQTGAEVREPDPAMLLARIGLRSRTERSMLRRVQLGMTDEAFHLRRRVFPVVSEGRFVEADRIMQRFYGFLPEDVDVIGQEGIFFEQLFRDRVEKGFLKYGQDIADLASREIFQKVIRMDDFIDLFLQSYTRRHGGRSIGQLRSLMFPKDPDATRGVPAVLSEMSKRVDEWENGSDRATRRAEKVMPELITQSDGAISSEIWRRRGWRYLEWVNNGEENCPICLSLNGRKMALRDEDPTLPNNFVPKGSEITADGTIQAITNVPATGGVQSPIRAGAAIRHPSIHGGCDCTVRASRTV